MLRRNRGASLLLASSAIAWSGHAGAGETTTYVYDGLGRLTQVDRSGTVNNGVNAGYCYDGADNRTRVTVNLGAPQCAVPPPPPPLSPPPPVFSISGGSANEGANLVFTVTRSGAAGGSYSVGYATSNGSATAGSDYAPANGTLTFAAAGSQTVSVATVADGVAEPAETVLMTLSAPSGGATLAANAVQATGTINASLAAPPPPPPGNTPPTALNDYGMGQRCQTRDFNVTANDSDADGDLPLTVTALNGDNGFSIVSGSTIRFGYGAAVGSFSTVYTVTDSRGASSTATLYVEVPWDSCE